MTSSIASNLTITPIRHILLADDSRVNQRVAQLMLEDLGCEVTVVANGAAAVKTAERANFDVILMDIEMPELDGFEATAMIRAAEEATGNRQRTPIIALTAHTTPEYRDRCMNAGMDGYVAKPLTPADLRRALDSTRRSSLPVDHAVPVHANGSHTEEIPVFDRRQLLERVCHDHELLGEIIGIFREDVPAKIAELNSAMEREDSPALEKAAHALKGMVGNFSALPAYLAASKLERLGRIGSWVKSADLVQELEQQIGRLQAELALMIEDRAL